MDSATAATPPLVYWRVNREPALWGRYECAEPGNTATSRVVLRSRSGAQVELVAKADHKEGAHR